MRFTLLRLPLTLGTAALLAAGCSGSDGDDDTGVVDPGPTPVATTVTITSGPIDLISIGDTATITATVQDQNGQGIPNPSLNFASSNVAVVAVSPAGVVSARGEGSASLSASVGAARDSLIATVVVTELIEGTTADFISLSAGEERLFDLDLPAAESGERRALEIFLNGDNGNADLLVRRGSDPTDTEFDCASVASTSVEYCIIPNPAEGEWRVAVEAVEASTGLSIRTRLVPSTLLQDGEAIEVASDLDFRLFDFVVPGGATASGGTAAAVAAPTLDGMKAGAGEGHIARLASADRRPAAMSSAEATVPGAELAPGDPALGGSTFGGSGDVDLIGASAGFLSNSVPLECSSATDGTLEACTAENPTPGAWQFALLPAAPFADVSFLVDFDEGGNLEGLATGSLTIRTVVESSSGGAPDYPADPSLAGFEFEIRPAGQAEAVATATTDSTGMARVALLSGTYDVVETHDDGLTDVTGPVTELVVPGGRNVDLAWVNRQLAPGSGGGKAPVAILNASPMSIFADDGNRSEVRLFGGNSSDPEGGALTFEWSAPNGTFIGETDSEFARVTFPGGTDEVITLTVTDEEGVQGVAEVEIESGFTVVPSFNIEIIQTTPITDPDLQAALDLAEARWEAIINDEVRDVNFAPIAIPADDCFDGQPRLDTVVDDLLVWVDYKPIDGPGGIVVEGDVCILRGEGFDPMTPIAGFMRFDSDDFESASTEMLHQVFLHQMAHIIGVTSRQWGRLNLLENRTCPLELCEPTSTPTADTRFIGAAGSRAYRALGAAADAHVPVENVGSVVERDRHWRESVFGAELMTPFLNDGGPNPLSILTIESLRDIGYRFLNAWQADDYSLPGAAPSPGIGIRAIETFDLGDDRGSGPLYAVGADGTMTLIREGR
ncbi:MAG: SpaA isopeptide-forming pilin-related protein [Longimicrobiales bacterium]|nr:SpaA isopeptide-forming pilin-related protein [Longimicrobiales bacterium]